MKNMFYIPTSQKEISELVEEIIKRNPGNIDITYIMLLAAEHTEKGFDWRDKNTRKEKICDKLVVESKKIAKDMSADGYVKYSEVVYAFARIEKLVNK